MSILNPEAGLVISYAYLWHTEHQAGQEEGRKDRPTVIVLAVERRANGEPVREIARSYAVHHSTILRLQAHG